MVIFTLRIDSLLLFIFILFYSIFHFNEVYGSECRQRLYEAKGEPAAETNKFSLNIYEHHLKESLENGLSSSGIEEKPAKGFVPGKMYRIVLKGWRTQFFVQTFRGFGVTATFEKNPNKAAGKFELKKNRRERGSEARVAPNCRTAGVSHTNLRPKTEVRLLWRAPETSAYCVLLQATVIQSRFVWYKSENELTKRFCVIEGYQKVLPKDDPNEKCCACDEADYDVEFIGIWSKETHPKEFPSLEYLTHFTDILGASHSANYTLFRYGELASDGLKEIAEWGNTYKGESEMKAKAAEIRTIIKLKGLWYPEVQGRTSGHFHVNKYHHIASLVAMFGPSPDWCVGVSDINLCLPDCSWVEERAFDLRPFDAGTDNGPTYMSPNNPAEPRIPVVPITTKGDKRSPFYDENVEEVAPLARLVMRRKRVQSAHCRSDGEYRLEAFNISSTSEDEEYRDRRECSVRNWESWSLCSATCGKGIRMRSRVYEFPVKAQMFNCYRQMTERQFCNAKINECENSEAFNSKCIVNSWTSWSECTVTCGQGQRKRERTLKDANQSISCAHVKLQDVEHCVDDGGEDCSVTLNPLCQTTKWSEWSPCSTSCDDGVRVRTRLFFYAEHELECASVNLMEKEKCNVHSCQRLLKAHSEEICQEEKEAGQCGGMFARYWFDAKNRRCERFIYSGCKGNRNQFETEEECKTFCMPEEFGHKSALIAGHQILADYGDELVDDGGDPTPCDVSEWSPWADCSVTCGHGRRQRSRTIKSLPRNGGTMCPPSEQLIQIRSCQFRPCARSFCLPSRWSSWSSCASTSNACDADGYQTRRRRVNRYNPNDLEDPLCQAPELEQRVCRSEKKQIEMSLTNEDQKETSSLISVPNTNVERSSADYGGISFKSAFSSFRRNSSPGSSNDPQSQLPLRQLSHNHDHYYQQEPQLTPSQITELQSASNFAALQEENSIERRTGVLIDVPSSSLREPRTRTNSERFHCHVRGRADDESDDEDNDETCAATENGTAKRHCKRRRGMSASTRRAIRALWISVVVCVIFMVCEMVGGVWAQSLAIITDAAHLLTDLASMLISLFSLYLASRPASQRMSFGWYRAEVVGAFISVFMIWVVTGILVYLAIKRIITVEYDIDAPVMAITAGLGVLVNIIMGLFLYFGGHSHSHLGVKHSHSHENEVNNSNSIEVHHTSASDSSMASNNDGQNDDRIALIGNDQLTHSQTAAHKKNASSTNINLRAAFVHVLGDLIQSVGVLIAALLILWNKSLSVMDPICTLLFSIIVISTTIYIIRDALVVLLEGRPSSIDFRHVFEALEQIEGVRKVHDLRIWALTMDRVAISVHLEIASNATAQTILKNTTLMLRRDFNVYESTVQIEGWRPDSANCLQCTVPSH